MTSTVKVLIVITLVFLIAVVVITKQKHKTISSAEQTGNAQPADANTAALPKLVDLGAGKCVACKAMKPILEDLSVNYSNAFETVFIDVWENPAQADEYRIELIPTQIFFDAQGKELFRHQGFFSKEDIIAKWNELGLKLD